MPEAGRITVAAREDMFDGRSAPALSAGRYVRVDITDRGVGIAKENLERIFDPYFSTKTLGTGLGLATAYSIVKRHGGRITVRSESGRGSTFTVYLPTARHRQAPRRRRGGV